MVVRFKLTKTILTFTRNERNTQVNVEHVKVQGGTGEKGVNYMHEKEEVQQLQHE